MHPEPEDRKAHDVPPVSAWTLRFFRGIMRGYFRRHFRAVMAQHEEHLALASGPLIVFANHSSWWDPMVCLLLASVLLPRRRHYAPIDAAALKRYAILRRIGMFPVETGSMRGAAQFLRASQAILESGGVLWMTPQGRFADAREPLTFKSGLGALAVRTPSVTLLPLAIEYTFWDERLPETLLRFGEPLRLNATTSVDQATQQLEAALSAAMQELKTASMARDASAFQVLLTGGRGTGGFYALGHRVRAIFTGRRGQVDHSERGEL